MEPVVDHINRYVSNIEKFIVFYQEALGYKLIDRGLKTNGQHYAILKGVNHELFLSEKDKFMAEKEKNFRHIGYYVNNVDQVLEKMKKKGYIKQGKKIIIKEFSRQFYVNDPDGFEIDIIQWTNKEGFYQKLKEKNEMGK